jgi:hypothetical protein
MVLWVVKQAAASNEDETRIGSGKRRKRGERGKKVRVVRGQCWEKAK